MKHIFENICDAKNLMKGKVLTFSDLCFKIIKTFKG